MFSSTPELVISEVPVVLLSTPETLFARPVSVPDTEFVCAVAALPSASQFAEVSHPASVGNGGTVKVSPSTWLLAGFMLEAGVELGTQGMPGMWCEGDWGDWGSVGREDMQDTSVLVEHSLPHGDGRLTRVPPLPSSVTVQ